MKSDLPTVSSREELDAMPHGSVVIYREGEAEQVCRVQPSKALPNCNDLVPLRMTKRQSRKVKKRSDYRHRDGRALLKIKLKSMAAEQAIIKKEERRTPSLARYIELRDHRLALRKKIRAAHLAYNVIRGRLMKEADSTVWKLPRPERQEVILEANRLCAKYGSGAEEQKVPETPPVENVATVAA